MMFKLNQVLVALMLSSSVLPSSHASNRLDGWDCSKCTIENYIGKDYELTKKDEYDDYGYDISSEFTTTVANLAKDGSTYEIFLELCVGGACMSYESDAGGDFIPLYTYDKTEDDVRAIYKYTMPVDDNTNNDYDYSYYCPDMFAVVEIVPLSPDSIEEVDVDSYFGSLFDMDSMMYTASEDCIFDRMYVNCFCDPCRTLGLGKTIFSLLDLV